MKKKLILCMIFVVNNVEATSCNVNPDSNHDVCMAAGFDCYEVKRGNDCNPEDLKWRYWVGGGLSTPK